MPLALGNFGTEDVTLTVNITIEKATPVISEKPDATAIDFGTELSKSRINGDVVVHTNTEISVDGTFSWSDDTIVPHVTEAAVTGYYVTLTPNDTLNYNTATAMVTLTVNKVAPTGIEKPVAINSPYNGLAEELIIRGNANGGTMKYRITNDPDADPPEDNNEFSSTIPSRANAGAYKVWYKVLGDDDHLDTEAAFVVANIYPAKLNIPDQEFIYNVEKTLTVTLDGIKVDGEDAPRTVVATLTANSKDKGTYVYSNAASPKTGEYTIELSNSNYEVVTTGKPVINPLPVVLQCLGSLTVHEDGERHTVTAEVTNIIGDDELTLAYADNSHTQICEYTAKITDLGNENYTLDGAQNVTQPWLIFKVSDYIELITDPKGSEDDPITYGDELTLRAKIRAADSSTDTVKFYVNREYVGEANVVYDPTKRGVGEATLKILNATSLIGKGAAQNFFSLGANTVRVEFYDDGEMDGMDAVTVFVNPKAITVEIVGTTDKTYDGNDIAAGLELKIREGDVEDYDDVTVSADSFTYNSANVLEASKITANNVTLYGAQSGNYIIEGLTDGMLSIKGTISKKAVKLEWRGVTGLVYNGAPTNVNVTATEFIPGFDCPVDVIGGSETDAGEYIAKVAELSNTNYMSADGETLEMPYTIARAACISPNSITPTTRPLTLPKHWTA